jgi:hypothetical protein
MKNTWKRKNKIVFLSLLYYFGVVLSCSFSQSKDPAKPSCGINPNAPRIFDYSEPQEYVLETRLLAIQKQGMKSKILIARQFRERSEKITWQPLISLDRGNRWIRDDSESRDFSNLNSYNRQNPGVISDINNKVRWIVNWRRSFPERATIQLSMDGGKSWEKIFPVVNDGGVIEVIDIAGIGKNKDGRLYAGIKLKDGSYSVYRSDDYGKTFNKFSDEILSVVESPVDSNRMVGIYRWDDHHHGIVMSDDGGKTWEKPKDYLAVNDGGYHLAATMHSIKQIEMDPFDADTLYILTVSGLHVSNDWGKTFKLLPIELNHLDSIVRIAVDPIDNGYIYAVVNPSELHRSSDRGCRWEKLQLPTRLESNK